MRSQQLHKTCSHCYSHTCAWQSFQSPFAPTAPTTPMAPITCKEEVNLAAQCRGLVDTEPRRSVSHHSPMPVAQCTHVCSTRYPVVWTPQNLSQAMQNINPKLHAWRRPITCKEEVNLAAKFRKLQLLKSWLEISQYLALCTLQIVIVSVWVPWKSGTFQWRNGVVPWAELNAYLTAYLCP